jgi:hypothetical protein
MPLFSQTRLTLPGRGFGRQFHVNNVPAENFCSACLSELPKAEIVISLFRSRKMRSITEMTKCKHLRSRDFYPKTNCELVERINRTAALALGSFEDVVYSEPQTYFARLESLAHIPEGDYSDLTGDHGKHVAKFLQLCIDKKIMPKIGSIIDVGGQSTSTVRLVSQAIKSSSSLLPSLIIDISAITPALAPSDPRIHFAIGDAYGFFSSKAYDSCVKDVVNTKPTLVLFNNILNVLKAADGWKMLRAAWSKMRKGDVLFISGLVPEQLEKRRFKKMHEVDGIVEFHGPDGFYKSTLTTQFDTYIETNLEGASVVIRQVFHQTILKPRMQVEGYRLLALRKTDS